MPSPRCGLSTWLQRASLLLAAWLIAPAVAFAQGFGVSELERGWIRVVQVLDPLDIDSLQDGTDEVLEAARHLEIERLTPMAMGLQLRSRTLANKDADAVLVQARRLDPMSPEVELALAQVRLRRGAVPSGLFSMFRGLLLACSDLRLFSETRGSLLLSATLGFSVIFVLWALAAVRRALPLLWHDLTELGYRWRLDRNTPVLAVLLLLLPVFLGFDFFWLGFWLLALVWAYFPVWKKFVGLLGLALIAACPLFVEIGFRTMTRPFNPIMESAGALEERRFHPQARQELHQLTELFGQDPEFHRLRGDQLRQVGLFDAAAAAYADGLRLDPANGRLSLALGVVRYLQKDFNSAIQALNQARESGADPVLVNYNLSLAFAQTYLFRESDEAMAAARRTDEARFRELTWGRDHLPLGPSFDRSDAQAMLTRQDPVELLARGILAPPLARARIFLQPVTLGAMLALLMCLAHFLVRDRMTGFSSSCLKCGRSFCPQCKLSTESQSYCTQCINIFLKKDMVAIDTQVAKRRQLARRQLLLSVERRLMDFIIPGLGLSFAGRPIYGVLFLASSFLVAVVGLIWLPFFVVPALTQSEPFPLFIPPLTMWACLMAAAQFIPAGRR